MMSFVITMLIAFISTNIDDLCILTFLFSQSSSHAQNKRVIIGQTIGMCAITGFSFFCAFFLVHFQVQHLNWLGVIPLLIGLKALLLSTLNHFKPAEKVAPLTVDSILSMSLITISSGSENICVYIPIFSTLSAIKIILTVIILCLFIPCWCLLAYRLANFKMIKQFILKWRDIIVPVVFIALGFIILLSL